MQQVPNHTTSTGSLSGVTYTFTASAADWCVPAGPVSLNIPGQSEWECEMYGCGRSMVWHPAKGTEPNWFWRKMQYLCFGNKWIKNDSTKNR